VTGGAAPKRKGSQFERDVVAFLRDHGHPDAERAYGAGRPEDVGDVEGVEGFVIECKAVKAIDLAGWCDEAERERVNASQPYGGVIAKRRGKAIGAAYVVLSLDAFARLLSDREDDQ
jgi:hypothetical protein